MKRRDLLKIGAFSALAAAAGTGFLKIYKHQIGVKKVIEFPAPFFVKHPAQWMSSMKKSYRMNMRRC